MDPAPPVDLHQAVETAVGVAMVTAAGTAAAETAVEATEEEMGMGMDADMAVGRAAPPGEETLAEGVAAMARELMMAILTDMDG